MTPRSAPVSPSNELTRLFRGLFVLVAVLLVPILPFLVMGATVDEWVKRWQLEPRSASVTALVVVATLAVDILLPIPSSVISTVGGIRLGWFGGTLASWTGMSLGAALGFGLARRWGHPLALRFTRPADLARVQFAVDRLGAWALVMTRGVPVFAEASVLLMGIHRMAWRRFLPPVLLSNLGLAVAYSVFGDIAGRRQWLPMALTVAIALPVMLAAGTRRWLSRHTSAVPEPGGHDGTTQITAPEGVVRPTPEPPCSDTCCERSDRTAPPY